MEYLKKFLIVFVFFIFVINVILIDSVFSSDKNQRQQMILEEWKHIIRKKTGKHINDTKRISSGDSDKEILGKEQFGI